MRTKSEYRIRTIAGEPMLVYEGAGGVDLVNVFTVPETVARMWELAEGKDFTEEEMVGWLLAEYEIDEVSAVSEVRSLLGQWRQYGLLCGEEPACKQK